MSAIRRRAAFVTLLLHCAFLTYASGAQAESPEEAFTRGREAMLRGNYEVGCPLLADSQMRDPRLGVTFTLAECELLWGKAARALAHYDAFLRAYAREGTPRSASNDERQRVASARRAALVSRVAFVTIIAPAPRPPGAHVRINDEDVEDEALGAERPVTPGVAVIVATGMGTPQRTQITVAAGEHRTILLASIPPVSPPAESVAVPVEPKVDARAAPTAHAAQRASTWTYAAGGIGVAGIVVGSVTGALVLAKRDSVSTHCPEHRCDPQGLDELGSARTLATVSTVAFVAGAIGLASATVLFVWRSASPASASASMHLSVGSVSSGAGAALGGVW
jgi:hypothetical protein